MTKTYSVKQASIILGFSTNSIYKFVNSGRLKNSRGNSRHGRFRITHQALESFLGHPLSPEYLDSLLQPASPPEDAPLRSEGASSLDQQNSNNLTPSVTSPIPLNITRGLIILSLLFILADIFISRDFSLLQQLIRLSLLAIVILLTYQFGSSQESNQHRL